MPLLNPPITTDWAAVDRANKPLGDARQRATVLLAAGDLAGAERECLAALDYARTTPNANPILVRALLADIYLREGRNREALNIYLGLYPNYSSSTPITLNICLAYCRLGDYRSALPYYLEAQRADSSIWEYDLVGQAPRPQDWPGTNSPNALEASALLARGISKQGTANYEDALRDFEAAYRLAPGNPLIAYHVATVLHDLKRFKEAIPYYRRAGYSGNRFIAQEAKRKVAWLQTWLATPPAPAAQPAGK